MTGKNSPEYHCGQILYFLKMSQLDYMLKETPYSAYITIRKKFIKNYTNIENSGNDPKHSENEVEIKNLKEHCKDIGTQLAQAKFDFEELEIQKDKLVAVVNKQDDVIENFLKDERGLTEEIKIITKKRDDLKSLSDKTSKEKNVIKIKFEENVLMHENNLEARDLKINSLEKKLKDIENDICEVQLSSCDKCSSESKNESNSQKHIANQDTDDDGKPSTSTCGKCEYESDSEADLAMHMKTKHALMCEDCDFESDYTVEMKEHVKKHHTIQCEFCNETFSGCSTLKSV